eukprot:9355024-Pyramimonas_sp.AAC.1
MGYTLSSPSIQHVPHNSVPSIRQDRDVCRVRELEGTQGFADLFKRAAIHPVVRQSTSGPT